MQHISSKIHDEYEWNTATNKHSTSRNNINSHKLDIPLTNRYNTLTIDDDFETFNDRMYNDDANIITNSNHID